MQADAERCNAVERSPTARFSHDLRQEPGKSERPQRQQDERMRDAAVIGEIRHRPAEAGDEIQVRRSTGEEAGGDAPRQRMWRRVLRCGGAREQRARERVREGV